MNMKRLVFVGMMLCLCAPMAQAKINKRKFESNEKISAGKLFMGQVDFVSLYLSTDHVVYVPRLTPDMKVQATITLLGMTFGEDKEALKEFVLRHINTFNKTLAERLNYYTPELAKQFKTEEDVEFIVQVGEQRNHVASWKVGQWIWNDGSAEPVSQLLSSEQKAECRKKCPALIKKKKPKSEGETVTAVPETPPS